MSRRFLFKSEFEIGLTTTLVEVFVITDNPNDVFYECRMDGEKYELWQDEEGNWFDLNSGGTNMSDVLGEVLNKHI